MTELRDARLRKALDEAPDAGLQPPQRTRDAIRAAARGAVQPAWRRWWAGAGRSRMPWTAALATVVLATLVTVLWEGREVPGARREAPGAETVATAPVPAPLPPPAAAPAPAPLPPPAALPAPAPLPAPATAPPPAPATRDADGGADTLAGSAPAVEEARAPAAAAPPTVAAAPPPPAPAPAPAPAPGSTPQRQAAPAAPAAALRASPASLPWSQVRIESGGRSVVVPRAQAGELPALITSILASPSEEAAAVARPTLRLELAQGDETAGVLELVGDHWRWTRLREARQARILRPEPGIAAGLRLEAERLLRR